MLPKCPYCTLEVNSLSDDRNVVKRGRYIRTSDHKVLQRYTCLQCRRGFSDGTFELPYKQKKRQINQPLWNILCSGVTKTRAARILDVNKKTVQRKLIFLGEFARNLLVGINQAEPKAKVVEFDDLETFEITKCKPLSVTLALEHKTRRILGFEVSRMPCGGPLAALSRKKYGLRKDMRPVGRQKLFSSIKDCIEDTALIKSDEHPHYPPDVRKHFPLATHQRFKSRKPRANGHGELKKGGFDPLFSLNHTFATVRADISRLTRKTWATTKDPARLADHLAIYAVYHNIWLERRRNKRKSA